MNRVDYRWPFKLFRHAAVAKPCLADCDSQRLSSHSETSKSREIFWNSIRIKKVACSSTGLRVCKHSRQAMGPGDKFMSCWANIITSAPSAISFRDKSDKPRVVLGTMLVKPIPRSRSLWSSTALIGSDKIPDKYSANQNWLPGAS